MGGQVRNDSIYFLFPYVSDDILAVTGTEPYTLSFSIRCMTSFSKYCADNLEGDSEYFFSLSPRMHEGHWEFRCWTLAKTLPRQFAGMPFLCFIFSVHFQAASWRNRRICLHTRHACQKQKFLWYRHQDKMF